MTNKKYSNDEWWLGFAWGCVLCSSLFLVAYVAYLIQNGIR